MRVAGPDASFAITPARFGISYPQPDLERLASLVGPGQAARLLYTAETIDAAEAHRIGLIELVCGTGRMRPGDHRAASRATRPTASMR